MSIPDSKAVRPGEEPDDLTPPRSDVTQVDGTVLTAGEPSPASPPRDAPRRMPPLLRYVLRRLVSGVVLFAATLTVIFFLMSLNRKIVVQTVLGTTATEDQIQAKMAELGLDRPPIVQFGDWIVHALRGDLGVSFTNGESVSTLVSQRAPVTLSLVIGAVLVTMVLAVVLGVLAATLRGWIDRVIQFVSVLGLALPGFWIALVLVSVFAIRLGWFPATGWVAPTRDLGGWFLSLVLPVLSMAAVGVAAVAMQIRSAMIDLLSRDFVRTLRSRGLSRNRLLFVHLLRNAAAPALTVLSLQFIGMLGGVVLIEQIFALPGLGGLALSAAASGDMPVVMGVVAVLALVVVIVNLAVDLINALLNPKVRLS